MTARHDTTREAPARWTRWCTIVAVIVLVVFHNDYWSEEPPVDPVADGFPSDMAYHLVWVLAATVVLWFVMRVTWRHRS